MTKKDYILISNRIKSTKGTYSSIIARDIVDDLALALAEVLRDDNPNFDTDKFLKACDFTYKNTIA